MKTFREIRESMIQRKEIMNDLFKGERSKQYKKKKGVILTNIFQDDESLFATETVSKKPELNVPDLLNELNGDVESLEWMDEYIESQQTKNYAESFANHVDYYLCDMLPTKSFVPREIPEVAACGPMDERLKTFEDTENELFALFKQCGYEVQFVQYNQVELFIQLIDEKKPLVMVLCFKLGDLSRVLVGCQKELWQTDTFSSKVSEYLLTKSSYSLHILALSTFYKAI